MSDCYLYQGEDHDSNYNIEHSEYMLKIQKDVIICTYCAARVLEAARVELRMAKA